MAKRGLPPEDHRPPHRCPACHGVDIERVRPAQVMERLLLSVVRRRVYRCRDCRTRFYDRPSRRPRRAA